MTTTTLCAPRRARHRLLTATATFTLAVGLTAFAAPAQADKPVGGCPGARWITTSLPTGSDDSTSVLWTHTLAGLEAEFGSVAAGLEALGVPDLDTLVALFNEGVRHFDKNGDGVLCMADQPDTHGFPAYIFNLVDNTSHSR